MTTTTEIKWELVRCTDCKASYSVPSESMDAHYGHGQCEQCYNKDQSSPLSRSWAYGGDMIEVF